MRKNISWFFFYNLELFHLKNLMCCTHLPGDSSTWDTFPELRDNLDSEHIDIVENFNKLQLTNNRRYRKVPKRNKNRSIQADKNTNKVRDGDWEQTKENFCTSCPRGYTGLQVYVHYRSGVCRVTLGHSTCENIYVWIYIFPCVKCHVKFQ